MRTLIGGGVLVALTACGVGPLSDPYGVGGGESDMTRCEALGYNICSTDNAYVTETVPPDSQEEVDETCATEPLYAEYVSGFCDCLDLYEMEDPACSG